jgi:sodium-dependent phosphate transporter
MPAGANDTANAAGPYAAVQHMYRKGVDSCGAVNTPVWVLAFCGLGIVTVSALISDLTVSLC